MYWDCIKERKHSVFPWISLIKSQSKFDFSTSFPMSSVLSVAYGFLGSLSIIYAYLIFECLIPEGSKNKNIKM